MLSSRFNTTSQDAALLLMKVRQIATEEIQSDHSVLSSCSDCFFPVSPDVSTGTTTPNAVFYDNKASTSEENCFLTRSHAHVIEASPTYLKNGSSCNNSGITSRYRSVSIVSSSEVDKTVQRPLTKLMMPQLPLLESHSQGKMQQTIKDLTKPGSDNSGALDSSSVSSSTSSWTEQEDEEMPTETQKKVTTMKSSTCNQNTSKPTIPVGCIDTKIPPINHNSSKLVGTEVAPGCKMKDVLRKKFSWKSFPELENFLIENRAEYLQYSNSLNYTAEQKRYNNRLTQGLLDLAAEEGYIFDGFTFAAVRDRIRCYYKSYVQATKKKKLKTKHR